LLREIFEERFRGMPGLRVLVVDDEKVIADTLVRILAQDGFAVTVAYSGDHAIQCAREGQFDVVLMDVMMPEMSGIEAWEAINKILPECQILLVSGNLATEQLLWDALDRGMNFEIFVKPVHPRVIIERLNRLSG
jgi:CheY-like chemotaxis protein